MLSTINRHLKSTHLKQVQLVLLFLILHFCSFGQSGTPSTYTFQPININKGAFQYTNPNNVGPALPPNGMTAEKIIQQNNQNHMQRIGVVTPQVPSTDPVARHQFILQQAQNDQQAKRQHYLDEIRALLEEDLPNYETVDSKRLNQIQYFKDVFLELQNMKNGVSTFSLKRAVFLIENAWAGNTLNYSSFCSQIDTKVNSIKSIASKNEVALSNSLACNAIIQQLYASSGTNINEQLNYDSEDFMGELDWSKMFVTKLLNTGKGQCHSLPLIYLILAEETKTNAWLAFAPEHSYIIFSDNSKRVFYNFETTNGNVVTNDWIMESGYVSTPAIRNRIYLDTLGKDQLLGTLIADLVMGYTNKLGYDDFANSMVDYILTLNPKSLQGHLLKADLQVVKTENLLRKAGSPPIQEINLYPEAYNSYTQLLREYEIIDALGYTPMPKEIYEQWLGSSSSTNQNANNGN